MPRFRFRLEASLRLAEIALDQELRRLAQEVQKLKQLEYERNRCENTWLQAAAGQRTAGLTSPRDLGIWQKYAENCLKLLRLKEKEVQGQAQTVQKCREALAAAHREAEKFRRLKERQLKLFRLAEEKREQKILDEAGQVLYWQKMTVQ